MIVGHRTWILAAGVATSLACGAATKSEAQRVPRPACDLSAAEVYKQKSHAVVFIGTTRINPFRLENRIERGLGSGFIFGRDGQILTNAHVVFGAQLIQVRLDNGANFAADIVGMDPIFDIAVLKIRRDDTKDLPGLTLGKSSDLVVGERVFAIGNPLGLDQSLTTGVVSALNRVLPETPLSLTLPLIQTDAAINPGNSGGPLLNRCGEAIGINTSIIPGAQNIGFAIPIDLVREALPQLIAKGRIIRPWIGFHGKLIGGELAQLIRIPLTAGLLVEVIEPGSPAEKAGLKGGTLDLSIGGQELLIGGDIIRSLNGIPLTGSAELQRAMRELKVGNRVKLAVFRAGKELTLSYRLPERPLLPRDIPD